MRAKNNIIFRNQSGQALVEYTIIMPLFLFVMLGVIQLSLIISARITLKYAAFCAARAAISAEHLDNEGVELNYPTGVNYHGDTASAEATEAALLVMSAIPAYNDRAYGVISLPGWGDLINSSSLRTQLTVDIYSVDNPDPENPSQFSALINSVDSNQRDLYKPITAKLSYNMQLLFPNISLAIIGVFEKDLFGDDNTITLTDSCTLITRKVPKL